MKRSFATRFPAIPPGEITAAITGIESGFGPVGACLTLDANGYWNLTGVPGGVPGEKLESESLRAGGVLVFLIRLL